MYIKVTRLGEMKEGQIIVMNEMLQFLLMDCDRLRLLISLILSLKLKQTIEELISKYVR